MPYSRSQALAIQYSYKERGKEIPPRIKKEIEFYIRHPATAKERAKYYRGKK